MTISSEAFEMRLRALEPRAAIAFMAALTERLLPNYLLYAELTGAGDAKGIRVTLDLVWEALGVREAKIDFARQAAKLTAIEPDTDADDSFGARIALDACMALSSCLEALQKTSDEAPVEVSRLSAGGVERFIDLREGEAFADDAALAAHIASHELMLDEQDFQQAMLEHVEQALPLERDRLRELRRLGRNDGISNLGLTLDEE